MKLTKELLKSKKADKRLIRIFETLYPNGVNLTKSNTQSVVDKCGKNGIDTHWLIVKFGLSCTYKMWHDNGKLFRTSEYKYGEPSGNVKYYYQSGKVNLECTIRNGEIRSYNVYNRSGEQTKFFL